MIPGPSSTTLLTDAPVDNHGQGESFSPTDLCATASGTCMLTIMGLYAGRHGIDGRLIARYPIDSACLVPYIFAAGGVQTNGETSGTFGAGGGLEYRVTPQKLGIFAEGRYTWAGSSDDSAQVRLGVRVVF